MSNMVLRDASASKKKMSNKKVFAALPDHVLSQVLSWLLEAEDHLLSLHSLGQKQLETVSCTQRLDFDKN